MAYDFSVRPAKCIDSFHSTGTCVHASSYHGIDTWQFLSEFWHFLRSFLENEAGEESGGMFGREVVEDAIEEKLRDHQLVAGANLASDSSLRGNDCKHHRVVGNKHLIHVKTFAPCCNSEIAQVTWLHRLPVHRGSLGRSSSLNTYC